MQRIYNLSDVSFLADPNSYHQIMIVIKASSDTCLFEQGSVRIKTTSLAIHEEMCPKVLDDVDEIVVELRLVVSNLLMTAIQVINNVWCKSLSSFRKWTFVKTFSAPVTKIPEHQ